MTIILLPVQRQRPAPQTQRTIRNALDTSFWVVGVLLDGIPPKHRFKFRKPFIDVAGNILGLLFLNP
jgi:hypothetical protein